jgi:hypothetical protein
MALSLVSTTTGLCLSGRGNRYKRTSPRPIAPATMPPLPMRQRRPRNLRASIGERQSLRRYVESQVQCCDRATSYSPERAHDYLAPLRLKLRCQFFMVRMLPRPSKKSLLMAIISSMTEAVAGRSRFAGSWAWLRDAGGRPAGSRG